ncbi:MAG: hypothetical protein KGI73_03255 [Patescibacteria group bacterium]|nr:hypothetical protein [Patescibacteria group bacterium]
MNRRGFFWWAPRILGILSILYIGMFALDVFDAGQPLSETLIALAMHLIPSAVAAVVLAVAWKYETAGGVMLAILSFVPFFFLRNPFWVNCLLAAPFFVSGLLFIASSWQSRRTEL